MTPASNLAPRFGALLFQDSFDHPVLSSDWKTIGASQWIENGWLHTKDTNGWPRDSEVVVHDGDRTWTNYSISLTAAFSPNTPWDYINIPLRIDGYQRSSAVHAGHAYELELLGTRGWFAHERNQIVLNRVNQGRATTLFRGHWDSTPDPIHIYASLDDGQIDVSINGVRLIDLTDQAPLFFGGVGVHTIWESEAQIDDLMVTTLPLQTTFEVLEITHPGAIVGTVLATDPDPGDLLTYSLQVGNTDPDQDGTPALSIDSVTGVITVQDSGDFDVSSTPEFHLQVQATDRGGFSAAAGFHVQVLNVNDPPQGANKTIRMAKNTSYVFAEGDFGFSDPGDLPANQLLAVKINTLPAQGLLTHRGIALSPQQWIPASDLRDSQLVFTPFPETHGADYAVFSFQVQDDGGTANGGVDLSLDSNQIAMDVSTGGGSWGDPHLFTYDGLNYDFQARGDFVLTRALDSELEVQVRQVPWSLHPTITLNQGVATLVDGAVLRFDVAAATPLVNGTPMKLALGETQALGQAKLSRSSGYNYDREGDVYTLTYGNGDRLNVEVYPDFCIDPTIYLLGSRQVTGLLGNNNGRPEDDLIFWDRALLSDNLSPDEFEPALAARWHVSPGESFFDPQPSWVRWSNPIPGSMNDGPVSWLSITARACS
ncbi:MAG: VWD domain-containing protein [Cyanobacteriota bacterium]|nr:VWD domain-containing protein [Cyanobacteriota bacterium]